MHRRAEFKESGERPVSLGVLGTLTHCGPKQGGSGWLLVSRRGKQIASFTSMEQVPGARSGSVRQDVGFMLEAKEGELGASCRTPPRQCWLLPAVEAGEKALRPSSASALIASVLVLTHHLQEATGDESLGSKLHFILHKEA